MDRQSNSKVSGIQAQIKNLSTFLFDLDGTLIDSSKDIVIAVNYTLKELGLPQKSEEEIIKHVGYGGKKLIQGLIGSINPDLVDSGVEIFKKFYFENPVRHTKLYPGVLETFKILKNKNAKIGIVTNKYENISIKILNKLGIVKYIDIIVGGDTTSKRKPDPDPILFAVNNLEANLEKTVMIGDSEVDIQAGKRSGVKTILVLHGFGDKNKSLNEKPDIVVENFQHLFKLISF